MLTIKKNGFTAKISYDEIAENPRDWENLFTLFTTRGSGIAEADPCEIEESKNAFVAFKLYMYKHSGTSVSLSPFSCSFDSGCCGYIAVAREKIFKDFGWKRITEKRMKKLRAIARSEVYALDQYLNGEVYEYIIEDSAGEVVDSLGGFFGIEYAKKEALAALLCYAPKTEQATLF